MVFRHDIAGQGSGTEVPHLHKALLDAIPHPVFAVDEDVRIVDCNASAQEFIGIAELSLAQPKSGDAMHCLNAEQSPGGCGTGAACKDCVIRNSVRQSFAGVKVTRRRCEVRLARGSGKPAEVQMLVTSAPIDFAGRRLALLVLEDITELIFLRKIIPICAGCRKVRHDDHYWQQVESYMGSHLGVNFSHGLCPDCVTRLYPEL